MQEKEFAPIQTRNWQVAWLAWGLLAFLGLGVMLVPAFMPVALAQSPTPIPVSVISDDQVNAIAKDMYCPVCESTPLDVCPTQACAEWRELIRSMLAEGRTEAEIKTYFVNRFGPQVLAEPPAQGFGWLIYAMAGGIILIGVLLIYGAFRAWRRPSVPATPAQPPADEYMRRLEEELRKQ
jgi:cytochrome c-type biogenesis protein CcmH